MAFVVQSPIADPTALQRHIETFIRDFGTRIAAMDEATFARQKAGLLSRIREEDKQLQDRTNRYWDEIDRRHYAFDVREQGRIKTEGGKPGGKKVLDENGEQHLLRGVSMLIGERERIGVLGPNGKPIAGAEVPVRLKRSPARVKTV